MTRREDLVVFSDDQRERVGYAETPPARKRPQKIKLRVREQLRSKERGGAVAVRSPGKTERERKKRGGK